METVAFSAQNCADVFTRALGLNVFRRLLNDHMLVNFATAQPTRIQQCRAAVLSVGGEANNGEDDINHDDWDGAGLPTNDPLCDVPVAGAAVDGDASSVSGGRT